MEMNKYNLVNCNKLMKSLSIEEWKKLKPLLEKSIIDLDDVKYITLCQKR